MFRKSIPLFLLAMLATHGAVKPRNLQMTAIRHWTLSDVTRVVVELSADFEFRTDRLHNPERVYFDILGCVPNVDGKRHNLHEVNDTLLRRVRVAETQPGTSRVVFDMRDEVEYKATRLSNPDRLVVEFRRVGGPVIPPPPLITTTTPKEAPPANAPVTAPVYATAPDTKPPIAEVKQPVASPAAPALPPPPVIKPPAPESPAATAASRTARGSNSLIRALGLKITRVVLDAGHGGHDQGTTGPHGLMEKELVLDVTQRLGKLIEDKLGAEVIFTRSDDTFIPLEQRTQIAMEKKADLFLSIHANSSPFPRIAGVETYYLNFTDSKEALDLARRENASSLKNIHDLSDIIKKITLHEKIEESRDFASKIQSSLFSFAQRYSPGIKDRGVKKAPFVVLIGAQMPSVLCEIGFVTNSREEGLLKKADHRQKLAEALYRGVAKYAESLSHFQVAQAAE